LGAKYGLVFHILPTKGLLSINKDGVEEEDNEDQCGGDKDQQENAPAPAPTKEEVVYEAAEEAKDMGIDKVESNDKGDDKGSGLAAELGWLHSTVSACMGFVLLLLLLSKDGCHLPSWLKSAVNMAAHACQCCFPLLSIWGCYYNCKPKTTINEFGCHLMSSRRRKTKKRHDKEIRNKTVSIVGCQQKKEKDNEQAGCSYFLLVTTGRLLGLLSGTVQLSTWLTWYYQIACHDFWYSHQVLYTYVGSLNCFITCTTTTTWYSTTWYYEYSIYQVARHDLLCHNRAIIVYSSTGLPGTVPGTTY